MLYKKHIQFNNLFVISYQKCYCSCIKQVQNSNKTFMIFPRSVLLLIFIFSKVIQPDAADELCKNVKLEQLISLPQNNMFGNTCRSGNLVNSTSSNCFDQSKHAKSYTNAFNKNYPIIKPYLPKFESSLKLSPVMKIISIKRDYFK